MKKIILLLSLSTLLFSCSNGVDASSNNSNNNLTITTINPTNITSTSFDSGGIISSNSGNLIYGICWNTSPNPTFLNNYTINSSATSVVAFVGVTGPTLNPNTIYYVRAYVQGSSGTLYGNEITITTNVVPQPVLNPNLTYGSVTDIDGNVYPTISICNKTWTARNSNTSKYKNGDVIPHVQDPIQWVNMTSGAWCYYKNDSSYGPAYGKLYNWYAVTDPRGIAPQGWHLPTSAEWTSLTNCMGNQSVAGCKLKEVGSSHWGMNNNCSTNESGFTAIPTGFRKHSNGEFYGGSIQNGNQASFCIWYGNNSIADLSAGSGGMSSQSQGIYSGFPTRFVKD